MSNLKFSSKASKVVEPALTMAELWTIKHGLDPLWIKCYCYVYLQSDSTWLCLLVAQTYLFLQLMPHIDEGFFSFAKKKNRFSPSVFNMMPLVSFVLFCTWFFIYLFYMI